MAFNFKASCCFLFGLDFHSFGCPSSETFFLLFGREDINWRGLFLLFICSLDPVRLKRVLVSLGELYLFPQLELSVAFTAEL